MVVEAVAIFVGEGFGVDWRSGDGDAGLLSGRLKGDDRGEPYERGEGLYEAAMIESSWMCFVVRKSRCESRVGP